MASYDQSHLALTPGVGRDDPALRPLWVKLILALGAVGFGGYALWMLTGPREYVQNRDMVLYCALLVVPFTSFLGRALLGGPARRAWWFFAAGAGLWLMAEIGYTATTADVDADPARWVDWSFIIAPLFLYAGVVLLAGVMLPRATVEVWLDGVIIACATAAFATLLFPELMENFSGSVQDVIVDMTSPLTGMLLVSLVLAVIGVVRGAAGAMWWLLLAGATLLWLSDMVWMLEVDDSSYFNGSLIDLGWPAGLLLLGAAPWARMRRGTTQPEQGWFVPLSLALATFGLLLYATQQSVPTVTVAFAAGTVMGGALRSVQAFRSASTRAEALRQARCDELTGLANRRGLNLALQLHPDDQHALLLVDIDRFKQINDTLGHQAGDEVLQQVSVRLQGCMGEGAVIGRLGADEFAILMPAGSGWATATAAADRLHDALNPPVSAGGIDLTVEISVGIALSPQHGTTLSELLRTADRAMYRAKRDRMGSLVFDQTWDSSDGGGLLMMQELRKAVDDGEFVCHYQPQLDVLTDEVVCVESLVRWQHPERGLIPAGHFLPMLEQTALIRPLSDLVLKQSLAQLRLWDGQGLRLRISVNLSATNLLDRGLPLRVARMLA
nr:diguanylate cyclase [Candidatus Nanopelagicales bacterium]